MTNKKILPDGEHSRLQSVRTQMQRFQLGPGFWALFAILVAISFISTYNWSPAFRIYTVGEVVEQSIAADRPLLVQDPEETKARREAVRNAQPLICSLNLEPIEQLRDQMQNLIIQVNKAESDEDMQILRSQISDEIGYEIPSRQFATLADARVQKIINDDLLPWVSQYLREGVISDSRVMAGYKTGVIIRNLQTGAETVRDGTAYLPDLRTLEQDLSRQIRELDISPPAKKLLGMLLNNYLGMPTLTPNYEATAHSANEAARLVQPTVHQIAAGEIIVRRGERIDQKQMVKLQALWNRSIERFDPQHFSGVLLCSLFLTAGLFFSPVSKKMLPVKQKELFFIGILLGLVTLLAKLFNVIGFVLFSSSPEIGPAVQAFALPIAGASGLAALTMANRNFYAVTILMSFFCTVVNNGEIGLFMFYLSSGILSTWLINDTQNRKEVVKSFLPLIGGMFVFWFGATMVVGGGTERFIPESLAVLLCGFLSIVFIFAISPLVEMSFGFTTRFVLMELMNQEHPAMRQLMLDAPGTYHHSMVVANLVEVAAKAIGAHSLLCKAGAMYHDIGKIEKPEYFIENQFRGSNPHDRLTPTMSALVLISHVKRGAKLAQQYRLGDEISDIITQHHGTSFIKYFYHKAVQMLGESNVRKEDFRYAGPRPQTREAALIMLADVIEASSRTLEDPTPSRIRAHVQNIVRGILAQGQLDGVDLTLRDLERVSESFIIVLTGIFHRRIEYPDKVPLKAEEADASATAVPSSADEDTGTWLVTMADVGGSNYAQQKKQAALSERKNMNNGASDSKDGVRLMRNQSTPRSRRVFGGRRSVVRSKRPN